jgi:dehydrogenase/reductase SDR family protein 12
LKADVDRVVTEFREKEATLHCLVCNAGALLTEKTPTKEGFETTFAAHLLFGTFHLSKQLFPLLEATPESRFVVTTSGGMYNTRFPSWKIACGEGKKYDGQLAYAYAKRGQVLLIERWAKQFPNITMATAHPGWTSTPGVDAAYGDSQSWLSPLRSMWQGTEGIAWLCCTPQAEIKSGSLYLDRSPQETDLFTKPHTEQEVDYLVEQLTLAADTCNPQAWQGSWQGSGEEEKAAAL